MAAEVEPVAVELDGLRDAADGAVGLEDAPGRRGGEHIRAGQPGRAAAEHGDAVLRGRMPHPRGLYKRRRLRYPRKTVAAWATKYERADPGTAREAGGDEGERGTRHREP